MRRSIWVFLIIALAYSSPTFAQCLHGPKQDAAQKARRQTALRFVRAINTAEANEGMGKAKRFLPVDELTLPSKEAEGFELRFTTDGKTYSFLLKDKTDPCGFTFFSNQIGIIFQGYPIDYEVQPIQR